MADNVISSAIEILDKIKSSGEILAKFTKADGSKRLMKCTLDFKKIPKKDHPKTVDLSKILKLINTSKILHVYDLEKKGWRSIPIDKTEWMEVNNIKYRIHIK